MDWISGWVWVFLIKPGLDLDPFRVFFFLNPYQTLFLIGSGKTQPIRVGPDRVSAGRAKIAIPTSENPMMGFSFHAILGMEPVS